MVTHIFWFIASISALGIGYFMLGITGAILIKSYLKIFNKQAKRKTKQSRAMKDVPVFIEWQSTLKQLSKQHILTIVANAVGC